MTTFNLQAATPSVPTGVSIIEKSTGYSISWALVSDYVEIWQGTTNDVASATKVATVKDTYYDSPNITVGTTYYLWLRQINKNGRVSSYDVGNTSGHSITINGIGSAYMSSSVAIGGATAPSVTLTTPTVSSYDAWYSFANHAWVAVANIVYNELSIHLIPVISSISSTGSDQIYVWARSRLYDVTASADVPGGTKSFLLLTTSGTTTYGMTTNIMNFQESFICGFRGLLISGHSYEWHCELMKSKTGSASCTLSNVLASGSGGNVADIS